MTNQYDDIIKQAVNRWWRGLDWLWIKAQIMQESTFNPLAVSSCGAKGLMQLMPSVIEQFRVTDAFDPEQNVEAGVRRLSAAWVQFKREDGIERMKFAFAGYNCGEGHIFDAQDAAEAGKRDSRIWDNVSPFLRQFTGNDNARQTINYVSRILDFYHQLAKEG